MKTTLLLLFVFTALTLTCCAPKYPTVTFADLTASPEQFNGKTVTIEGIYLHGWEGTLLTQGVSFVTSGETKELIPVGESIWLAGMIPLAVQEKFSIHAVNETETQRYGKIRVTGKFDYGEKYGNDKRYKYRITATDVTSLDWTPPQP